MLLQLKLVRQRLTRTQRVRTAFAKKRLAKMPLAKPAFKTAFPALALLVLISTVSGASFAQQVKHKSLWQYSGTPVSRVYADVQWGVQAVRHSDLNFFPYFVTGTLGFWVFDNLGIETFGDLALQSDKNGVFELEIEEAGGIGLRFQSPPKRGFSLYLLAGYVDFQVTQVSRNVRGRHRVSEGFGGVRMGIGLAQRLRSFDSVLITGEYRNYYSEDEIQLDAVSIGLRVNVR